MSTFTQESSDQLKACGEGLFKTIIGITDGVGATDVANALVEIQLTQACVDEIKADKPKAIAAILGAALTAFSAS